MSKSAYFEERRAICKVCQHATLVTIDGKTGVAFRSRCSLSGMILADVLASPGVACPDNRFAAAVEAVEAVRGVAIARDGRVVGFEPGPPQRRCGGCGE